MSESDGIDESVTAIGRELAAMIRMALMGAAQVAERRARERERDAHEAQARDATTARQAEAQFAAERAAALAQLRAVHRDDWWESADPQQIGDMYALARTWGHGDHAATEAQIAEQKIAGEVRTRHGIDVADLPRPAQPTDPARGTGPHFTESYFENEMDKSRPISKETVLAQIAGAEPEAIDHPYTDFRGWSGIDPEVDAALHAKWPNYRFTGPRGEALPWVGQPVPGSAAEQRPASPSAATGQQTDASPGEQQPTQPVNPWVAMGRTVGDLPQAEKEQVLADLRDRDQRFDVAVFDMLDEQATLAGMTKGDLQHHVQPRHLRDLRYNQVLTDRGIVRDEGLEIFQRDWTLEQALMAYEPETVHLADRDGSEVRDPYGQELLAAAAAEAEQAGVPAETYLDHLEVGHHDQLLRAARNPQQVRQFDGGRGLTRLQKMRIRYAQTSVREERPVPGRVVVDRGVEQKDRQSDKEQATTLATVAAGMDAAAANDSARDARADRSGPADQETTKVVIPGGRFNPDRGMSPSKAATPEEAEHRRRTWKAIEQRWTHAARGDREATGDERSTAGQRWADLPFEQKRDLFWKEYDGERSRTIETNQPDRYTSYLTEHAPDPEPGSRHTVPYDSRERRQQQADQRIAAGLDPALVAVEMSADVAFAAAAQEAVKSHPSAQTVTARKGQQQDLQLGRQDERTR